MYGALGSNISRMPIIGRSGFSYQKNNSFQSNFWTFIFWNTNDYAEMTLVGHLSFQQIKRNSCSSGWRLTPHFIWLCRKPHFILLQNNFRNNKALWLVLWSGVPTFRTYWSNKSVKPGNFNQSQNTKQFVTNQDATETVFSSDFSYGHLLQGSYIWNN